MSLSNCKCKDWKTMFRYDLKKHFIAVIALLLTQWFCSASQGFPGKLKTHVTPSLKKSSNNKNRLSQQSGGHFP